jgi:hypothetical protein
VDQGLQKFSGEEDHVEEDHVEMTGKGSGEVSRVDEDLFEKELRLANETRAEELRDSTTPRYRSTGGVDERKTNPLRL